MLHKMGSHYFGVDFTVPEMIFMEWLSWTSILLQFSHTGQVYFAAEYTRARADVLVDAPQDEKASFCIMLFLALSLAAVFSVFCT